MPSGSESTDVLSRVIIFVPTDGATVCRQAFSWLDFEPAVKAPDDDRRSVEEPESTSAMLGTIRAAFSLNVTELAEVLRVERPTVYSWLREDVTLRPANRERLVSLWRLAERWTQAAGGSLGELKHSPVTDGYTVLDLLRADPLRRHPLGEHLDRLARLRRGQAQAPRGRRGRAAAALLGLEGPTPGGEERIAFESQQPTGPG